MRTMITFARTLLMLVLFGFVAGACASSHQAIRPPTQRIPDSVPERIAGLRASQPETNAAATEERFGAEADRDRRDKARAAKAERERRVDVIERAKKLRKR